MPGPTETFTGEVTVSFYFNSPFGSAQCVALRHWQFKIMQATFLLTLKTSFLFGFPFLFSLLWSDLHPLTFDPHCAPGPWYWRKNIPSICTRVSDTRVGPPVRKLFTVFDDFDSPFVSRFRQLRVNKFPTTTWTLTRSETERKRRKGLTTVWVTSVGGIGLQLVGTWIV